MYPNTEYKTINGTSYVIETPDHIVQILERARRNRTRIILDYGDTKTGKSWGEVNGIIGYVGRSTGNLKIPLLVYNSRSHGGECILSHCIVKISESKGKRVLWQHENYTPYEEKD